MKITYNSPFTLTFSIVCVIAFISALFSNGWTNTHFFSISPELPLSNVVTWIRFFTHALGHASWEHLFYNLSLILLIGPILEEKYGASALTTMSMITAFITGLLTWAFFSQGVLGASGIAFMLIVLSSITNLKQGTLPLTFLIVSIFYIGNEIMHAFADDNISQMAHIVGGFCGGFFGYIYKK
jgi:membrane associated rhomboid family serine protease